MFIKRKGENMKRLKAGVLPHFPQDNQPIPHYYTSDYKEFFILDEEVGDLNEDNYKKLTKEELNDLAVCLNSPWSQTNEKYVIKVNCKDAYTDIAEGDFAWKCEYLVHGYEYMTSSIIGYGHTENEALLNCMENMKYLQKTYNKEDESF